MADATVRVILADHSEVQAALRDLRARAERAEAAIDAALRTTWTPDEEGGWGDADDTLHPDRFAALDALQPFWQQWGDVAWDLAGRAGEERDHHKAEEWRHAEEKAVCREALRRIAEGDSESHEAIAAAALKATGNFGEAIE